MTIRVGIIGAGIMGADHARTLARFVSGASVSMVADVDPARVQAVVASIPGARATTDAHELIADGNVDAVVIASHDSTHADYAVASVLAGKPVLCEKPLAPSEQECLRVLAAEREVTSRGGVARVSVGFMRRFDPAYSELKAKLAANKIGSPLLLHCVSRGVSAGPGATSESSITGSAIHEFDTVPWILNSRVSEVSWHAPKSSTPEGVLQDPQVMLLRTEDGVLTTVECFLNAGYGYDIRCEVIGRDGAVALANPAAVVESVSGRLSTTYARDWRPRFAEAYRLELQSWVDAVSARTVPTLASARDGLAATMVAQAAIESMRLDGLSVSVGHLNSSTL